MGQENNEADPTMGSMRLPELGKLKGFKDWDRIGISAVGDIIKEGSLISFGTLQLEFQLDERQRYKYAQLRHAWNAEKIDIASIPEFALLEGRLLQEQIPEKAISWIYKTLINNIPDNLVVLRKMWETSLGTLEDRLGGGANLPERGSH